MLKFKLMVPEYDADGLLVRVHEAAVEEQGEGPWCFEVSVGDQTWQFTRTEGHINYDCIGQV